MREDRKKNVSIFWNWVFILKLSQFVEIRNRQYQNTECDNKINNRQPEKEPIHNQCGKFEFELLCFSYSLNVILAKLFIQNVLYVLHCFHNWCVKFFSLLNKSFFSFHGSFSFKMIYYRLYFQALNSQQPSQFETNQIFNLWEKINWIESKDLNLFHY